MSELKAISGHEIREDIDYNTRGIDPENKEWCNYGKELCDTLYYRKSEADEVIAEKDKEIADLVEKNKRLARKDLIMASETIKDVFKELRHQKFKRCLAMAKWCLREYLNCYKHKITFWLKWRKRWLKIAEQFKEAK